MTNEVALKRTNTYLRECKCITPQSKEQEVSKDDNIDFAETIKNALKKQIPKKPTDQYPIDWGIGNYGACQCGKGVNYQMKFCPYCGQALDWSDDK